MAVDDGSSDSSLAVLQAIAAENNLSETAFLVGTEMKMYIPAQVILAERVVVLGAPLNR